MNMESHWTVYRTRFLVRARQLTEPLAFTDALGRDHSGLPGDYLVESSSGIRCVAPRTIFEDIYVPLEPSLGSPRSSPQGRSAGALGHHSPGGARPRPGLTGTGLAPPGVGRTPLSAAVVHS